MNIASRIRSHREKFPDRDALVFKTGALSGWRKKTFRELDQESDAYARGFKRLGITRGTKTILMVKPSPELFSILFALFKLGAVPVVVDPGMGMRRMLHCYRSAGAEAFIGIPLAQWVRVLFFKTFSSLKIIVTTGDRSWLGVPCLGKIGEEDATPWAIESTSPQDLLMINFTTGSTGPAKGVEYTHEMADQMIQQIMSRFEQGPDSVTFVTLPLFGVFDLLIGSTAIMPRIDPNRPGKANPKRMIEAIRAFQPTHLFASPAFLNRVVEYIKDAESARNQLITLHSLKHILAGGAPVSFSLLQSLQKVLLDRTTVHAAYGATEALPIASVSQKGLDSKFFAELSRGSAAGLGTCVGMPASGMSLRLIKITDAPISDWSDDLSVEAGELGEILIAGVSVSPRYHRNIKAQELSKIHDQEQVWHRTGDLGWVDANGQLWFCGRKTQRLIHQTGLLHTVQWEGVFDSHPEVHRSALVGVGPRGFQEPVVCVELKTWGTLTKRRRIESELRDLASNSEVIGKVSFSILYHRSFPVDIRHNAKIDRPLLARWAAQKLSRGFKPFGVCGWRRWLLLVPILGWVFIGYGLYFPLTPLLNWLWWMDILLSFFAHGIQLFAALPAGRRAGFSLGSSIFCTFLLGATWWKSLELQTEVLQ